MAHATRTNFIGIGRISTNPDPTPLCIADDDCPHEIPIDAPIPICRSHAIKVYIWIRDGLSQSVRELEVAGGAVDYGLRRPAPPTPADLPRGSVVYYLRFGDRIKIGTSRTLSQRIKVIPHDEVLATEPGAHELEHYRHEQFRNHRLSGFDRKTQSEWFRSGDDLLAHIEALRAEHGIPGRL